MLFLHPWGEDRPGVGLCSHQLKANGSSAPAGTRQKQSSSQLSFPLAELWAAGGSAQSSRPGGRKAALRSPQLLLSGRAFCKGRRPQSLHQNKKQHRGNGGGGRCPWWGSAPSLLPQITEVTVEHQHGGLRSGRMLSFTCLQKAGLGRGAFVQHIETAPSEKRGASVSGWRPPPLPPLLPSQQTKSPRIDRAGAQQLTPTPSHAGGH